MSTAQYAIGVDLGGTLTKVALVSADGRMLASRRIAARLGWSVEDTFLEIREEVQQMAAESGLSFPAGGGCGIGVPGVVDHRRGRVELSGPLGWRQAEVGTIAAAELECETFVDTDVNAGALADLYFGCARDAWDVLFVSWGTGIGAGLAVGRSIYHSRGGAMCNLGHMPAELESTRQCYCGTCGCLEIEAGGSAIVEQVKARLAQGQASLLATSKALSPQQVAWATENGDVLARDVLERAATLMARVLAGVLALLNPDTVVFGGGVSRCLHLVQGAFDVELQRRAPSFSLPLTRIITSHFGDDAGMIGAAMLPAARRLS